MGRRPRGKTSRRVPPSRKGFTTQFTNRVIRRPSRSTPSVSYGRKINLHHHQSDHEPYEHCDGDINLTAMRELQAAHDRGDPWNCFAKDHADQHTDGHPLRKVTFEKR